MKKNVLGFDEFRRKIAGWSDAVEVYLTECFESGESPDFRKKSLWVFPDYPISSRRVCLANIREQLSAYVAEQMNGCTQSFSSFMEDRTYHLYRSYLRKNDKAFADMKSEKYAVPV